MMKLSDWFAKRELIDIIAKSIEVTVTKYTKTPILAKASRFESTSATRNIDIAGVIRFEASSTAVELFLGFTQATFLEFCSKAFQASPEEVLSENKDLPAEMLNIAFGAMDPAWRLHGLHFKSSFPVTLLGEPLRLAIKRLPASYVRIPFEGSGKAFDLDIFESGTFKQNWRYTPLSK